jgi:hypothetical protein
MTLLPSAGAKRVSQGGWPVLDDGDQLAAITTPAT